MNKLTMKATKRILCLLLCLLCLLAAVPLSAIAEGEESPAHIETCVEGCTGEDCTCTCHTAAEPAAHIETCVEGCTGEDCACTCHTAAEPAAHIETCVEGCTGEGCTCTCHAATVTEQDNKEQDEQGEQSALFGALLSCTTCEEMHTILDNADVTAVEALTYDELTALIEHVGTLTDDDAAKEELIYDLTVLRDGEAMDLKQGGGSSSSSSGRYYHFDFRVDATVTVKVLKADGTIASETVNATASSPTAVIYNTGNTRWSGTGTTSEGIACKNVTFSSKVSTTENEYMDSSRNNEFYAGDTVALTYTLTYKTSDGTSHTVQLTETRVLDQSDNVCDRENSTKNDRGFDIVVSAEDITTAMTNSQLQISKAWNDNNNSNRPDSITVKVYQSVNGAESHYMTLTLNKDHSKSTYAMATGYTADDGMKVEYSNNYGVIITGLPANHWVNSNSSYTFVSCSYSVEEVLITDATGTISPVYGSFIYVDDTKTDSYIISITNTLAYEKLAVKKVWTDSETEQHASDSVKVKLTAYYGENQQVPDAWLADFIGDSTEVTLNSANSWYQVLGYMPVYYTVDGNNYAITAFKIEETEVTVDNSETYTATYSEISTQKDDDGNYLFTVTNTPKPKAYELKVTKTISGNMTNKTEKFKFTVTINNVDQEFELGHEGTQTISVPVGASVVVTEEPGDFTYSLKLVPGTTYDEVENGVTFTMPEQNVTVEINNDKSITPETGIILDALPYVLILAIVAGGVVLMLLRRRRSYED